MSDSASKTKRILNRKNIFILVILLILIVGGLFFLGQIDKIDSFIERRKMEKMVAPSRDYTIVENYDGRFVVNKKDELKVKIPSDWEIEVNDNMEILESDREVVLYSKNFSYRPPDGCLITIQINRIQQAQLETYKEGRSFVVYPFEGAEEIIEMINSYKDATQEEKEKLQESGIEVISVDQKSALREVVFLKEDVGKYITVKIPTANKLYIFGSTQLSETCHEEFNKFLETISIL